MNVHVGRTLRVLLLGLAYFVVARLVTHLALVDPDTVAAWPPAGVAVAGLLLMGTRQWPGVWLGALASMWLIAGSFAAACGMATAGTLEAVLAAWAIERWARGRFAPQNAVDVLRFAAIGGVMAPFVGATLTTASLAASGVLPQPAWFDAWMNWFFGDGMGIVLVAPVLLVWIERPRHAPAVRPHLVELVLFASVAVLVALGGYLDFTPRLPLTTLVVPMIAWAAIRFGQRSAISTTMVFAVVAVWATTHGLGPFSRGRLENDALVRLQTYMDVLAVIGLAVSALVGELEALNADLERRVGDRTDALRRVNASLVDEVRHRERAEIALRSSELRLLEAQAAAHVGNWEWDLATDRAWASDEFYRLHAVDLGVAPSLDGFLTYVPDDDRARLRSALLDAREASGAFAIEHRVLSPDGRTRWVAAAGRVVCDEAAQPVRMVGTSQDISDRKRAEEEREARAKEQAARVQAEEANRFKDQFLARMSHELRTPLNAVVGWAHMLATEMVEPDRITKALGVIERNAQTQAKLIENLLDVGDLTTGRLRLEPRRVELGSIISAAVNTVGMAATARNVAIDLRFDGPAVVKGDAQRLHQIMWNLLSNAVKFSPAGSRVDVAMTTTNGQVSVRVTDTGRGIDPASLGRIFDPFLAGEPDRQRGGLGLGLPIVRALTEAHGGVVEAASRGAGQGASFEIRLPLAAD